MARKRRWQVPAGYPPPPGGGGRLRGSAALRTPTTPPPQPTHPLGASGQQLVAKDVALRRPWAPKAPDAP